jgi:mRNA-degrading endonuclease RelE of RelBE toxin-antitoxin system
LPWSPAYAPTFRRDYTNLAIRDILDSDNQMTLGRPKYGKWKGAYGYDVGRAIRVLYSVDPHEKTVVFLRCGPHTIY